MFSITEHIEYLMTRHDCVVVPGWGAFIANYSPARYDGGREALLHPRREVVFNADLTHNDGLLVQSIMRREGMSFNDASRCVADSVAAYRQQLAAGNEVPVGRLGCLRRNDGRYTEFVPYNHAHSCDNYYGLADVEIQPVATLERLMTQRDADDRSSVVVPAGRNLFTRRAIRIAASVVALIGLGITLTTPIVAHRDRQEMASMAPTVTAPQAQTLDMTVQQGSGVQAVAPNATTSPFANVGSTEGKYYMVISTLRNQQELDAFKAKYPELVPDMKILNYRGMMCVYVARSDDYNTLMALRDKLPEALRDVWIYS